MSFLVRHVNFKSLLVAFFLFAFQIAMAAPATLEYQGRILKSDGTPLEYGNVSFLFQITDPSGSCIIYQEQRSGYSMVNSGGVFDVPIGSGTVQYPLAGGASILDAFDNSAPQYCGSCTSSGNSYSCTATTSQYTPIVSDGRLLRVSFYDGSGWKLISPDNVIRSVPYSGFAMTAQKLGTNVASDFLLKAGLPTCSTGTFLSWDGSSFTCAGVAGASGGTVTNVLSGNSYLSVVNGATTPTLTVNVGTVANTVAAGNDSRIVNALQTGATAGGDLSGTLPSPTVAKIQGEAISTTAPASGNFLKYTGSAWTPAALATSDVTGLDTALNGKISASQITGSCAANQTLVFLSPSSTWTCTNIAISDSQITYASQSANKVLAAPTTGSGVPTFRTLVATDLPSGTLSGSGTAGYVPYYSAASTLANSSIYFDGTNVGLGTTSPAAKLHFVDEGLGIWFNDNYSSTAGSNPALVGRKAAGTAASPSAVQSGQVLMFVGGRGYDGSSFTTTSKASMTLAANENWSSTSQGSRISFSTTPNGSTTSAERMRIDNTGYVGIGTSSPTNTLEVRGGGFTLSNSSIGTAFYFKPEDQGATYTNTADQRNFLLGTTSIGTDFGYKFSWRNADGTMRQDALTFAKDGSVGFSGNVGVGTTSPVAKLHVAAAVTATANYPLFALGNGPFDGTSTNFFTGGSNGTVIGINTASSYTGDFVNFQIAGNSKFKIDNSGNITSSGNTTISGNTTSSGNYTTTGNISTTGAGTITSAGGIVDSATTSSTSSSTGALVVSGGAGIGGDIYSGASINAATNLTAGTSLTTPKIYGGTAANSTLTLAGTSNGTPSNAYVILQPTKGNVGIGTTTPGALLALSSNDSNATSPYTIFAQTGATGSAYVNGAANVSTTATTVNSVYGALDYLTYAPTAASSAESSARQSEVIIPATNGFAVSNYLYGAQAKAINLGSGNVTGGLQAVYSYASNAGTGTVSNVMGVSANAGNFSTGTVSNLYGLRVTANNLTGGTVTNSYGVYVGGMGSGGGTYTNMPFDIYASDTGALNYFAGKVGIGATAPLNKLDVGGGVVVGSGYAGVQTAPTNGIASQGSIYINQTAPYTASSMTTPLFQVSNVGDSNTGQNTFSGSSAGFQSRILLSRSRGATVGDFTTVQSGDSLGSIHFAGADGTGFITSSQIMGQSDGTISTGIVPGRILFLTANSSGTNAERMRLDSKGNLGLGTTTPSGQLHVYSGSNTYTQPAFRVQQAGSFTANNPMNDYVSTIQTYGNRSTLGNGTQHGLYVQAGWNTDTYSTEIARFSAMTGSFADVPRMVIQSSGNVGIGTTAPVAPLSIASTDGWNSANGTLNLAMTGTSSNFGPTLMMDATSGGGKKYSLTSTTATDVAGSGKFQIWDAAASKARVVVDSSGNVGIGTTNPVARIHNSSDGTAVATVLYPATATQLTSKNSGTNDFYLVSANSDSGQGSGGFYGVTRSRGTTASPISVAGGDLIGGLTFNAYDGTAVRYGVANVMAVVNGTVSTGTIPADLLFSAGANERMRILSSGYVGIGTSAPTALFQVNGAALATAWNTSSDVRLKEHIQEIASPLSKISQLRGVEFDWRKDVEAPTKHDETHDIGVIAQEVEKVFPEAVTTPKEGFKAVAYSKLVAPLIGAVKELYAKFLNHDAKITAVDRRIAAVEENKADKTEIEALKKENAALKAYLCSKDPKAAICH